MIIDVELDKLISIGINFCLICNLTILAVVKDHHLMPSMMKLDVHIKNHCCKISLNGSDDPSLRNDWNYKFIF